MFYIVLLFICLHVLLYEDTSRFNYLFIVSVSPMNHHQYLVNSSMHFNTNNVYIYKQINIYHVLGGESRGEKCIYNDKSRTCTCKCCWENATVWMFYGIVKYVMYNNWGWSDSFYSCLYFLFLFLWRHNLLFWLNNIDVIHIEDKNMFNYIYQLIPKSGSDVPVFEHLIVISE